jgi:hypothetical protein
VESGGIGKPERGVIASCALTRSCKNDISVLISRRTPTSDTPSDTIRHADTWFRGQTRTPVASGASTSPPTKTNNSTTASGDPTGRRTPCPGTPPAPSAFPQLRPALSSSLLSSKLITSELRCRRPSGGILHQWRGRRGHAEFTPGRISVAVKEAPVFTTEAG